MNGFQIVGITVCMALALLTLVWVMRRPSSRSGHLVWIAIWLVAAITIARPEWTSPVASALGIGRGVDVILYANVLVSLVGFYVVYGHFRRLDQQMTNIVRQIAIARPLPPPAEPGTPHTPPPPPPPHTP